MKVRNLNEVMTPVSPKSLEEWKVLRQEIIENLRFASGIDLLKHDAPLNAQVFDTVEYDGFVVEKVIFQSLPGFYVTGNLYRPKDTTKKYPAVLHPHGHWAHGRLETDVLARIPQRCANFALRGMVAFSYDMIGYNDSTQLKHHFGCDEYSKWNFGRFAMQANNSVKAVDFLESLPYVDTDRIGCTGCSGGGTQTYFLSVLDERVKVAAPINMASTRMQGGCVCENAPFLRTKFNNIDYTMCIAPRPLFLSGATGDWTVDSETVEFPAVQHVYDLYGQPEKFEHFYQVAPHCYNLPIRERVYRFFCRNFGIDDPFDGEVDMEFDTESLKIGGLESKVPADGFVKNDSMIFEIAKKIIRENLGKLNEEEKQKLVRKVYAAEEVDELDIPYAVEDGESDFRIRLGDCPDGSPNPGIDYYECYNYAPDSKRIGALCRMMKAYPSAKFIATGKSALLCEKAAKLTGHTNTELTEFAGFYSVPGGELAKIVEEK